MARSNKMGMSAGALSRSRKARFGPSKSKVSDEMDKLYDRLQNGELSREEFKAAFEAQLKKERS